MLKYSDIGLKIMMTLWREVSKGRARLKHKRESLFAPICLFRLSPLPTLYFSHALLLQEETNNTKQQIYF